MIAIIIFKIEMDIDIDGTVAEIKKQKGLLVLSNRIEFKLLTPNNKTIALSYDQFLPFVNTII